MRRPWHFALLAGCVSAGAKTLFDRELQAQRDQSGMRDAITVASVVGDAYWPSVAPDGSAIVFTAAQSGSVDVWKKVLATGALVRLTDHSADDEDPAFSPDGKHIAFVSRREDAKGDIYVMDADGAKLTRLSDENAAERAPAWAPDGKSLFISLRPTPAAQEDIYRLPATGGAMERITLGGGFDASVDPSGLAIVHAQPFTTDSGAESTRVVARRLSDGKTISIGDGRRPEAFPRFVRDTEGKDWVYFTRYVEDDNRDGRIDAADTPSLYRAPFAMAHFDQSGKGPDASEPLTSGYSAETLASAARDKLFFVGVGTGGLEIQVLPLDGASKKGIGNDTLFQLADSDVPPRMRRYFLRIIQARGGADGLKARYEIARDFAAENRLKDAEAAFDRVIDIAGAETPLGCLARLEELRNQFFMHRAEGQGAREALAILRERALAVAPSTRSKLVSVRARVIIAEAAAATGAYEVSLIETKAAGDTSELPEDAARIALIEASIASVLLPEELEQARLIVLMRQRSRQVRESKAAKDRIIALLPEDLHARLQVLSRLLPLTAGTPQIRVPLALDEAETLDKLAEPGLAISKLRALEKGPLASNDRGRVLQALGIVLESGGELGDAISSFERLASDPQFNRAQRKSAGLALLRLALKKARADEARGDLLSAFEAYRTLVRNNPQEASAHRKVMELGDRLGKAQKLDAEYARAAALAPFDPLAQYAAGLAATYVDDLARAKAFFQTALELDSSLAYAHLGLGWVYEQEEYAKPGRGDALERAIYEYSAARALFERTRASEQEAEAALNLGNAFARLGQFDLAFAQYLKRETAGLPFQSPAQEIVFRERFGQAGFRTGEYDVALMTLKDGIRLAEREGDDRRLGRMRALLALCYDALELPSEALKSLIRARDEYAANGDFNRVISLDRTIGWLSLQAGDLPEAIAALERAERKLALGFGPKGFAFGVTIAPLGIITPIAIDGLDASRAPLGFSRDDEQELLQTLLARINARIGDTDIAAAYQEKRLALLTAKVEKGALAAFIVPDALAAHAEMMALSLRRDDHARSAQAFADAVKIYAAAETRNIEWVQALVRAAARVQMQRLDGKARAAFIGAVNLLGTQAQNTQPQSAAKARVISDLQALLTAERVHSHEREIEALLASDAEQAAARLPALLKKIDGVAPATTTAQARTQPGESKPAADKARGLLAIRVSALLDDAENAFCRGESGEEFLVEAEALAQSAGLWDAGWQADYLRFRVGPSEGRAAARKRAAERVAAADITARLVTPELPRGSIWEGLMAALLADALARKDANAVAAALERRQSVEDFVLPRGIDRPDLPGAEASRKALEDWAKRARVLLASARHNARALPALRTHLQTGDKIIADAAEPWRSLLRFSPDAAALHAALGSDGDFEWEIPHRAERLRLEGSAFVISSTQSAAPSKSAHYIAAQMPTSGLNVASANALLWHARARNIHRGRALDYSDGKPTFAAAAPPDAETLSGEDKSTLSRQVRGRGVIRFAVATNSVESSPGVFHFAIAGETSLDARLSSLDLPSLGLAANTAVIDGLSRLDPRLMREASRTFALAGTPTVLFCAPTEAKSHAALLAAFYQARAQKRGFDAWREAAAAHPAAGKACSFWGLASDDAALRLRFAESQLLATEAKADAAKKEKRFADSKALYLSALDFVRFVNPGGKITKLAQKELLFIATLAQVCVLLAEFDDAIAFQHSVLDAYLKQKEQKNEAEARALLGIFFYRAGKHKEAALASRQASALFAQQGLGARYAATKLNEATALLNAAAYPEAVQVYRDAAAAFAKEKNTAQQILALRNVGIVLDQNMSEFDEAEKTYQAVRALADASNDKLNRARSRIDLARIYRQLARYDEALKTIREVLALFEPADVLTRGEALLELARIYWYSNDYAQALTIQEEALRLAEDNRKLDERRADFLRIQAMSLEGLVLLSQGKRIAASNRLRRALRLARLTGRKGEESAQLNNFGVALGERGLLQSAERVFSKAISIDTDLKSKDGLAFDFRNMGLVLLRQAKLQQAQQYLQQADTLNKGIGNRYNGMQIQLGFAELALAERRHADASTAFDHVIEGAVRLKSRDTEWRGRLGKALAASSDNDIATAKKELESAFAIVEALGPKLEEAQSSEERIHTLGISALHSTLASLYIKSKDTAALWSFLERLRRKELRDQVPPAVWAKRFGLSLDDARDPSKVSAAAKARGEHDIEALFATTTPALTAFGARAVLLVRAFPHAIIGVQSDARGARIVQGALPKKSVDQAIAAWLGAFDTLQAPPVASAALFEALQSCLGGGLLDAGTLLLLPDGALAHLPWAALPLADGKRLVERTELSLDLSATHALATHAASAISDLIAVAPVPEDEIPFAALETSESVALLKEQKHPARLETLASFQALPSRKASFWHLALHGDARGSNMQGAYLRSGESYLAAFDLLQGQSAASTVLLSACRKPGSTPSGVELVTALKLSGARRVLAPASRVYDDFGATFVKRLVRRLLSNGGPEALRAEQLEAKARGEPPAAWGAWLWFGK